MIYVNRAETYQQSSRNHSSIDFTLVPQGIGALLIVLDLVTCEARLQGRVCSIVLPSEYFYFFARHGFPLSPFTFGFRTPIKLIANDIQTINIPSLKNTALIYVFGTLC
jgi:uncharacterized protein (DUF3820 family)